jgi:hypothetical protein
MIRSEERKKRQNKEKYYVLLAIDDLKISAEQGAQSTGQNRRQKTKGERQKQKNVLCIIGDR